MAIKKEILDHLLSQCEKPEDFFGKDGLINELSARLVERALEAEMMHHLGFESRDVGSGKL